MVPKQTATHKLRAVKIDENLQTIKGARVAGSKAIYRATT
jgi:hypothetical protein